MEWCQYITNVLLLHHNMKLKWLNSNHWLDAPNVITFVRCNIESRLFLCIFAGTSISNAIFILFTLCFKYLPNPHLHFIDAVGLCLVLFLKVSEELYSTINLCIFFLDCFPCIQFYIIYEVQFQIVVSCWFNRFNVFHLNMDVCIPNAA